jgi:protein-L-isoaspartate(D-aspartate) O-methyltransferase
MVVTDRTFDRQSMVERQLRQRGIHDERVLDAFRDVPREAFIGEAIDEFAYEDTALPIEEGQTISQPFIVALMLQALDLRPTDRVLEVGAGSGYAAAILARLAGRVYAIERNPRLAELARGRLRKLGYDNVEVRAGDGTLGWPDEAPFDAILVSAGGRDVPKSLLDQLAKGGRLVIPVGGPRQQRLLRIERIGDELFQEDLGPVAFVPLIGEGGWKDPAENERSSARSRERGGGAGAAVAEPPPAVAEQSAAPAVIRRIGLPELVAEAIEPVGSIDEVDLRPLVGRIGDATLVLIGEASHGTSEFYRMRARITRRLIELDRIRFVAIEADWPDAARIDRYVRWVDRRRGADERDTFLRFPTWMWRNQEVLEFVDWLRAWNEQRGQDRRVAVHGLDLYSLSESAAQVIAYLQDKDPELAQIARQRYACLTPFQADPATYGLAAATNRYRACEDEVVAVLRDLLDRRLEAGARDGDRFFDAVQNAQVVADAERYYRAMYGAPFESWNLRDRHMFKTLLDLLDAHGTGAAGAVWAHNSHLGDASVTEMAARGELNIGQLARERFGEAVYSLGFGTHTGTVAAAPDWDGEVQTMHVIPSREDSYEYVFHQSGVAAGLAPLRSPRPDEVRSQLMAPRLERAIGVIYRPETELLSHYFQAVLPRQFDEYGWFDETHAVTPLGRPERLALGPGHPFATLDV